MKKTVYIYIVLLLFMASGCNNTPQPVERITSIYGVNDSTWVYYSLVEGDVVGTGRLLSEEDDAIWAKRDDWDFALCGDMLRTNGGTSGKGQGGILQIEDRPYNSVNEAPIDGYILDTYDIVVKKD